MKTSTDWNLWVHRPQISRYTSIHVNMINNKGSFFLSPSPFALQKHGIKHRNLSAQISPCVQLLPAMRWCYYSEVMRVQHPPQAGTEWGQSWNFRFLIFYILRGRCFCFPLWQHDILKMMQKIEIEMGNTPTNHASDFSVHLPKFFHRSAVSMIWLIRLL